ncbi:type II toxin-antitoxin system RelE family toxin [Gracilimonas mengyeensis]|uniref:mRNA-degrading endonuclease RelE, toxin component of the RelBE toxin-antitoxin system n=1 Tax=Gracilimonas mengyeensis TaxID=1302730 RepID=A0A521AHM7_9BACT|nr:type II toxin-antitoxin system RelE/ParE family toxin [Gracilimonas mengyeensis]SMO34271.1 mRNA-degrading endonuclease RelE, toxin component of the RelBE toxin-antitoxin system [Gracilimonas mengyeensis]
MKIIYAISFKKDLSKINDRNTRQQIKRAIQKAKKVDDFKKITNIKSIKGEKNAFRLRAGDYRIGLYLHEDTLELVRVAHRKDIYRLFP